MQNGDVHLAEINFKKILKEHPDNPDALSLLGILYVLTSVGVLSKAGFNILSGSKKFSFWTYVLSAAIFLISFL